MKKKLLELKENEVIVIYNSEQFEMIAKHLHKAGRRWQSGKTYMSFNPYYVTKIKEPIFLHVYKGSWLSSNDSRDNNFKRYTIGDIIFPSDGKGKESSILKLMNNEVGDLWSGFHPRSQLKHVNPYKKGNLYYIKNGNTVYVGEYYSTWHDEITFERVFKLTEEGEIYNELRFYSKNLIVEKPATEVSKIWKHVFEPILEKKKLYKITIKGKTYIAEFKEFGYMAAIFKNVTRLVDNSKGELILNLAANNYKIIRATESEQKEWLIIMSYEGVSKKSDDATTRKMWEEVEKDLFEVTKNPCKEVLLYKEGNESDIDWVMRILKKTGILFTASQNPKKGLKIPKAKHIITKDKSKVSLKIPIYKSVQIKTK